MYINVDDETKINLMSKKKKQKINPKHNSITLYRFLLIYRIQFIHDIQLNKLWLKCNAVRFGCSTENLNTEYSSEREKSRNEKCLILVPVQSVVWQYNNMNTFSVSNEKKKPRLKRCVPIASLFTTESKKRMDWMHNTHKTSVVNARNVHTARAS